MRKKMTIGFVVLIVVLISLKVFLFDVKALSQDSNFALNIEKIQNLAVSSQEKLPIAVRTMLIATARVPKNFLLAGDSLFEKAKISYYSFEIVYPNYTIVMDPIYTEEQHRQFYSDGTYNSKNYEIMQQALRKAQKIIFTHEHFDHISGAAKSAYFDEIKNKFLFTRPQILNSFDMKMAGFTDDFLQSHLPAEAPQPTELIAPGLVAIQAPGHSPGNQMFYLQLANGQRFLFTSCIAWTEEGITDSRPRPWISSLITKEDRSLTGPQLLALKQLSETDTGLHLIVAHDSHWTKNLIAQGLIQEGFE